ncbi:MAG: alpha/beta fold hydrolase [Terriglobia bacterium]
MLTFSNPARPKRRGHWLRRALTLILVLLVVLGGVFYWRPFWVIERVTNSGLRLSGVKSDYVLLGSYRIHYFVGGANGENRPLVLVHGLGGRAQDWAPMMPSLMRRGYRVYALDLLGFGQSDRPDVDYSIALQTQILEQFFESQRLTQADLGGWSMGGWVALRFTLTHPERVRRVFVDDSAGIYFKLAWDPALFHPATVEQAEEFLGWLTPEAARIPRFFARDMIREMRPRAWVVDRAMKSMQAGADLLDGKLQGIQAPALIVWGKQDILVPLACGEEMHREIPQSLLETFDGCGHLAPVECVNRILPETIRFLEAEPPLPPAAREFPK